MKGLGYLGAFVGGALTGAVIGILIAPDKGSNTREKISNTVDDFLKKHNIKLNRKDVGDLIERMWRHCLSSLRWLSIMLSYAKNMHNSTLWKRWCGCSVSQHCH